MKIFLAGVEKYQFGFLTEVVEHFTVLFSYFHYIKESPQNKKDVIACYNRNNYELICDSGLFTLMFGVGKGGNYDLEYMKEYTKKYITWAKTSGFNNITFVESDVHKLLGMPAVFELRKYFEDSGLKTIYVWHREEGIEGLLAMARKYKYIAISVPELRFLFKGKHWSYRQGVFNLLNKIRQECPVMPKIHLLGNTVQETMETPLAYSCDSTSWLGGGRWGRSIFFIDGKLKAIPISSGLYSQAAEILRTKFPEQFKRLDLKYGPNGEKQLRYMVAMYLSAQTMKQYQYYLDKHFPWVGLKESENGNQRTITNSTNQFNQAESLEPQRTI